MRIEAEIRRRRRFREKPLFQEIKENIRAFSGHFSPNLCFKFCRKLYLTLRSQKLLLVRIFDKESRVSQGRPSKTATVTHWCLCHSYSMGTPIQGGWGSSCSVASMRRGSYESNNKSNSKNQVPYGEIFSQHGAVNSFGECASQISSVASVAFKKKGVKRELK